MTASLVVVYRPTLVIFGFLGDVSAQNIRPSSSSPQMAALTVSQFGCKTAPLNSARLCPSKSSARRDPCLAITVLNSLVTATTPFGIENGRHVLQIQNIPTDTIMGFKRSVEAEHPPEYIITFYVGQETTPAPDLEACGWFTLIRMYSWRILCETQQRPR